MAKPTLIYYEALKYQPENIKKLKENFNVLELPSPAHDYPEALAAADVLLAPLGFYCGKKKIDAAPKLKVIGSNTTGHPHIDVAYAVAKGVQVVTLKDDAEFLSTITPTAELTWGLIIALTRNLIPAYRSVIEGKWDRRPFGGRAMLSRMKLGVVGFGRLGKMVARYGRAFGMNVVYHDPNIFEEADGIYRLQTLEELVAKSDIITVHVPHEKETQKMFDRKLFAKFKQGAFFINTSRGELVDHASLLECLKAGTLTGAAMDVFEDEFDTEFKERLTSHALWEYAAKNPNLILTPHIGGSTYDAWRFTEVRVIDRIIDALKERGVKQQATDDIPAVIRHGSTWALIPARGGSKSIRLKNMAELNGRPLIDYVIRSGQSSKQIERIFCSTDNKRIKEYCLKSEIEACDRPGELAEDDVPSIDVILHFLNERIVKEKILPEFLVLLEPTSPFVLPEQIDQCVAMLKSDPSADSSQTVCKVEPNSHAYNQRYNDSNGSHFIFPQKRELYFNKQLKPNFFIHGNVRVMRVRSVMTKKDIFGDRSLPLVIPRIYGTDVDGPEDLEIARCLCRSGLVRLPK